MKYTVTWSPEAEDELATIWTTSVDRNRVTQAANRIDRRIAADASNEGESRENNRRLTFESPLAVVFEITTPSTALVVRVSRYG